MHTYIDDDNGGGDNDDDDSLLVDGHVCVHDLNVVLLLSLLTTEVKERLLHILAATRESSSAFLFCPSLSNVEEALVFDNDVLK